VNEATMQDEGGGVTAGDSKRGKMIVNDDAMDCQIESMSPYVLALDRAHAVFHSQKLSLVALR
jgi:hypothetical protein